MRTNLKQVQWLVFWLSVCLALTAMWAGALAASTPVAGVSASSPSSPAQNFPSTEPEFETLRDAESIDNQAITALVQDTRGLIWIGTQNGLVRYDGYRFRKFIHKAGDPFSLAGDFVYSLAVAKDGRIWVGTVSDGISVFDPASERFEHFRHDEKVKDSLSGGRIWAMVDDGQGGMWITTDQGLDHLAKGSERSSVRFIHFKHSLEPHSLLDDKVRSLLLDKAGRLWVGGRKGLQRLSLDGKRFETVVADRPVLTLFQAQDGKLWLGTGEHGAGWLDGTQPGGTPPQVHWLPLAQLSHPWITGIAQVQPDQIWLTSAGGGIIVVAANDGQVLQTLRHDPSLPGSLAIDTLKPMLLDRAGWLWVGTVGAGLQRTNANNTMLRVLRHSPKRPNGLSHPDVRSMLELADGRLLIGSKGNGIDIFDRQRGLVGAWRAGQGQDQTGALPDKFIYSLAQTGDGSIWAGTQQAGVVRQRPGSSTWEEVPGLPNKQVQKLLAGRDGSVWAGTDFGVARWLPHLQPPQPTSQAAPSLRFEPGFEVFKGEDGKPMQGRVFALAEDAMGRIWIGATNGLWLHEPGHKGLIHISAEPKRPDGLVSNYILGLLVDSRGKLWVATDKGLLRLKSLDGKLARFEHGSALLEQLGKATGGNLLEDRQGRIWTSEGVIGGTAANDLATRRMNGLTAADGMDIGATWIGSFTKTRDGLLLYGGSKGVAVIEPARFKPYDYAPPLVVTELKINGETVAPQNLINPVRPPSQPSRPASSASLTLNPTQRNFAIEFAALDYSDPRKNRYQYRLQGYDKDWINTDADHRSVAYGNLWPGLYTLQVRGSNREGEWSTHELSIPIRVLPAWWQTWWFALVLLLLMGSLLAALVQMRTRYLRQRQRMLEQVVDERTSELRLKQVELLDSNHELNQAIEALNESNKALNEANTDLALSVETLRQLGDIGREITANLDADTVFQSLYLYVGGLLDAPTMMIYRMNATATALEAVFLREDDKMMPTFNVALDSPDWNAAKAARERQELLLHYDQEDYSMMIPGSRQMLTALFAPLIVDDQVLGVMSIQSDRENAYGQRERLIFRTLTAFGAIALSNSATHTELTAAHRQLQETQQQLMLQEKMAGLGTLTAGIAHEINNPTNFVHVSAQIQQVEIAEFEKFVTDLIEGDEGQEVLQAFQQRFAKLSANVGTMLNGTERIIAIVKDLRSFSRLDESARKTVRLSECLHATVNLVRTAWLEKVDFITEFTDDPELECWPALLNQVFINLLLNGCQAIEAKQSRNGFSAGSPTNEHGHQRGTLWLRLHLNPGKAALQIEFEDNGSGIEHAIQQRIMEPFFTTKAVGSGTGTGLSTAFGIVQKHGGNLEFTSSPGEGSCFIVTLPLAGV